MRVAGLKAGSLAHAPHQSLDLVLAVRPGTFFIRIDEQQIHLPSPSLLQSLLFKMGDIGLKFIHQKVRKIYITGLAAFWLFEKLAQMTFYLIAKNFINFFVKAVKGPDMQT